MSPYQSAYRKFHSTETVLVKVHNDIITAIDRGDIGALAMLDLTSAFDTVDHQILLDVLCQRFAVNDLALVSAFFISRLDYGNATLSGFPQFTRRSHSTCYCYLGFRFTTAYN